MNPYPKEAAAPIDEDLAELANLYRTAPIGLCTTDRDLRFIRVNEKFAEIRGIPVAEHIGRTLREVLPSMADRMEPSFHRVLETGELLIGVEIRGRTAADPLQEKYWLADFYPIKAADGTIAFISSRICEVTEQKKDQLKLLESETRYRTLVEHAPDAICVVDFDTGCFVDFNQQALDLFGVDREKILTLGPGDISPPLQPDGRASEEVAREKLAQAVRGGRLTFQWMHRHTKGHDIPCEIRLIRYPATDRILLRGTITDISERVKTEQALRESEKELRLLLESTDAIPWEADAETWQFTYVGPQVVKLLGYPAEEWYEQGFWTSHIHPADREESLRSCMRLSAVSDSYDLNYRMIASDGRVVWLHDLVSVELADGKPRKLRGFMIDVTERRRAELLQAGQARVLEDLAGGARLRDVLARLAQTIDDQETGMRCSILLLDEDGEHLRLAAAPSLPEEFGRAVDGIPVGEGMGVCGSAAYEGKRVVVTDTFKDPLCKGFRELVERFNLRACWSQPILAQSGRVLGTFAMYYDKPYHPEVQEFALIEQAAHLAGVAIERSQAHDALRESEAALRRGQEELRYLAGRLLTAQEEERRRLARELHDDLTQRLACLAIEAGKLEQATALSSTSARESLRGIVDGLAKLSQDVHGISRQLHPSIIEDLGLVDAIASECTRFSEREGIPVEFVTHDLPPAFNTDVSICIYRVIQESLRNIARHSQANKATVTFGAVNGDARVVIRDAGIGFDPGQVRGKGGLGLASMEERMRLLNGKLVLESSPGRGTMLEVTLPLPERPAEESPISGPPT